ncbi:MAG: alpha-galactosidase [Ktedonobacteraceae bacterium]|nr:alpha-galactosidase [Ktedonobacteraceae bacterium]
MADDPNALSALDLQTYLDTNTSPIGPALQRLPFMNIGIDETELTTLPLEIETTVQRKHIHAIHPHGLTLVMDVDPDQARQALIWQVKMAQGTTSAGPRLHHFRPLQIALDGTLAPDPVIHTWRGGSMQTFFPPDASTPQSHVLYPRTRAYYQGGHLSIGTRGGRSSDQYMPYLLITTAEDKGGLWCAIGWSGHWSASFVKPRGSVDLQLTVQIEPCDLRLPAGTELCGPSIALGLYEGDYASGCNALRSWLRSRMPTLPSSDLSHFNTWAALDANVDEALLLNAVERVSGHGLRYFMLDAGWYPSSREDFSDGVGNWHVDETKFPRGLEVVAQEARSRGMEMGLWFEPERAHISSELAQQHPDWLLRASDHSHALVNFALPAVRAYFREVISDIVQRLGLRWLKWDFNMDPLPCWEQAGDGGLSHLGHINGLWETFDWLRTTFPDLVVENCASGGNRLDWTLFSRAHVNFANDQYTQPDCIRRILGRMGSFLPSERLNMIYGPFQRREYGDDAWQVLAGSAFGISEPLDNWSEGFRENLRRHLAIHHATDAFRSGTFYRLTPDTPELSAWEGWQMHEPSAGTGLCAVWRSASGEAEISIRLCAIDETRSYTVTDLYRATSYTVTGEELARGLKISLPRDAAALYTYYPLTEMKNQ